MPDYQRCSHAICLAIAVRCSLMHQHVIAVLHQFIVRYGHPQYLRSDNGPELIVHNLTMFLKDQGIIPSRMESRKP